MKKQVAPGWRAFSWTATIVGTVNLGLLAYFLSLPIVMCPPQDPDDREHLERIAPEWFKIISGCINAPGIIVSIPAIILIEEIDRDEHVLPLLIVFVAGTLAWATAVGLTVMNYIHVQKPDPRLLREVVPTERTP